MNKDEQILNAMRAINFAQQYLWDLHHRVKVYDKELGMAIWEQSLQIEQGLLELNDALFGRREHFEPL